MAELNGNGKHKSFEERLDALAMTLELMMRDRENDRLRDETRLAADERRWAEADRMRAAWNEDWRERGAILADAVEKLVRVATAHDDRLCRLEGRS